MFADSLPAKGNVASLAVAGQAGAIAEPGIIGNAFANGFI
jgi:hypothetical protein